MQNETWPFHYIDPNDVDGFRETVQDDEPAASLEHSILTVAQVAMVCFCGEFPLMILCCDIFARMSWFDEYWCDGHKKRRALKFADLKSYLYPLDEEDPSDDRLHDSLCLPTTKERVQALAVEVVMFANACIWHLREDRFLEAMRYMAAAYERLFYITVDVNLAQPTLWVSTSRWIEELAVKQQVPATRDGNGGNATEVNDR